MTKQEEIRACKFYYKWDHYGAPWDELTQKAKERYLLLSKIFFWMNQ